MSSGAVAPCPLYGERTDGLHKHVSAELSQTTDSCTSMDRACTGCVLTKTAVDATFLYQNYELFILANFSLSGSPVGPLTHEPSRQ